MAKPFPASFIDFDPDDEFNSGGLVLFDGPNSGGWDNIQGNQHWLLANRTKHHVCMSWQANATAGPDAFGGSARTLRVTGAGAGTWTTVLEFRITPRRHMPRLYVRANGTSSAGTGRIRVVTPAATTIIGTFAAGAFAGGNEIANNVACTDTQPPTRQLVQVDLDGAAAETVDLRRLLIMDVDSIIGSGPFVIGDLP